MQKYIIALIIIVIVAAAVYIKLKKPADLLKAGAPAPLFTLPSASGESFSLETVLGKKIIVLFFYPKDFSPGCTAEACTFRDAYSIFKEAGAEVIGISSDSTESHLNFAKEHSLPFMLLSDEKGEVRKLYKTGNTAGLLPGRVTFVIDRKGIVRNVFSSQFEAKKHIEEALRIVKEI